MKKVKKKTKKKVSKKKTRLNAPELKKFREMLLVKRREILGDVSSMEKEALRKERSDLSNVPFHMADAGSDSFEQENTLGLMDEEIKLLVEIDAALDRIEKRTFGICAGSGKIIPKTRLEAIPWARYSVGYAELLEKGRAKKPGLAEEPQNEYDDEGTIDEFEDDKLGEPLENYYDDDDDEEEEKI